jgi:SseB protein N-terminal domain/SseB protein C-terminal domain
MPDLRGLLTQHGEDPEMSIASDNNTVVGIQAADSTVTHGKSAAAGDIAGQHDPVSRALAAAVRDAGRIGELLDALKSARLWLPLPDDGSPVITGTAVTLPTVSYLGSDFVPAYSSAEMLRQLTVLEKPALAAETVPHAVVRAVDLARLLPPSVGIALNAGATESVPVYPQGVAYLAEAAIPDNPRTPAGDDDEQISFGPLPPGPANLLAALASALAAVPQVSRAAAAWLTVRFSGEGLVISVTLDDPRYAAARDAAAAAIEQATAAADPLQTDFPIDVTFPGEGEPDLIDDWFASRASSFYQR